MRTRRPDECVCCGEPHRESPATECPICYAQVPLTIRRACEVATPSIVGLRDGSTFEFDSAKVVGEFAILAARNSDSRVDVRLSDVSWARSLAVGSVDGNR